MTRSDKIVNLKKIDTTVDSIKESLEKDIILETSTTVSDFGKQTFTISLLTRQIKKMQEREARREEGERIAIPDVAKGAKKDAVVDQLVKSRAAVFAKHTTLKGKMSSREVLKRKRSISMRVLLHKIHRRSCLKTDCSNFQTLL